MVTGPDEHLAIVEDAFGQGPKIIAIANKGADRLRHRAVAHCATFISDKNVEADGVELHKLVAPAQQMEIAGISFPGVSQHAQTLIDLHQVALQLVLEQQGLVVDVGGDTGFRLGALGSRGADSAEPGESDQRERGGQYADKPCRLTDAHSVHRQFRSDAIRNPLAGAADPATMPLHKHFKWQNTTIR